MELEERKIMLTIKKLKEMKPNTVFAKEVGLIEHPWFNNAKETLCEDGRSTQVKWIAIRGGIHDWAIYHSLDANLEPARYLDGISHLEASWEMIERGGAKLHDRETIKKLVPCTDEALEMYRD